MNFIYISWIEEHGNALLREVVDEADDLSLSPIRITPPGDTVARRALIEFANNAPLTYARLFEKRLLAASPQAHALVLTLDWTPPMRIAAEVARAHGLPVLVIPHEGVFLEEWRYYRDPHTGADIPIADRFLAWGHGQKDIFAKRGYDEGRITVVGSPKLQKAASYVPGLSREDYCARLGLSPERGIVMFCAQTLDNVGDPRAARQRQAQAVEDLLSVCRECGLQLILRLPTIPQGARLEDMFKDFAGESGSLKVVRPGAGGVETTPSEATWHADCVASFGSTMLLEKGLMNGPSVALQYIEETSPFVRIGALPVFRSRDEIAARLPQIASSGRRSFPDDGWARLERAFSAAGFDDDAATERLRDILREYDKPIDLSAARPLRRGGLPAPAAARALHLAFKRALTVAAAGFERGRALLPGAR